MNIWKFPLQHSESSSQGQDLIGVPWLPPHPCRLEKNCSDIWSWCLWQTPVITLFKTGASRHLKGYLSPVIIGLRVPWPHGLLVIERVFYLLNEWQPRENIGFPDSIFYFSSLKWKKKKSVKWCQPGSQKAMGVFSSSFRRWKLIFLESGVSQTVRYIELSLQLLWPLLEYLIFQ